ncbi:hypothetical protein ACFLZL_01925 [Thermodesulfobacteriota bacterium]
MSKKNILYLTVFGTTLLAIFLFTLFLNFRTLEKLSKKITHSNYQIESQQLFAPLYQNLLLKMQAKKPQGVPFPDEAKLAQEDTGKILSILQDIARANELRVEQLVPDVDSSIDGSKHLMININMLGEFLGLRKFLFELISIPYFEHIEQIKIQSVEGAKEIQLRIWMAKE